MRWTTITAAFFAATVSTAFAGEPTGLSLACPWGDEFAACVKRWDTLVPAAAKPALDRCKAAEDADANACTRQALERAGIAILSREAVDAERDRQLGEWAARRTAQEEPAIRKHREAAEAKLAEEDARRTAGQAAEAKSKAEVDKLLLALQADNGPRPASPPATPSWNQNGN